MPLALFSLFACLGYIAEPDIVGLQIGWSLTRQALRLVGLRQRHPGLETLVDEKPPDLLVREVSDKLLDVHAAVAERASLAVGLGNLSLEGDDPFQPRLELVHASNLPQPCPHEAG